MADFMIFQQFLTKINLPKQDQKLTFFGKVRNLFINDNSKCYFTAMHLLILTGIIIFLLALMSFGTKLFLVVVSLSMGG